MKQYILSFAASFTLCSSAAVAQDVHLEDEKSALGPVAAMELLHKDMYTGKISGAWDAMPKKYQNDLEKAAQTFGNKVDPDLYNEAVKLLNSLNFFLTSKKGIIIELIEQNAAKNNRDKGLASLVDNWDTITDTFTTLLDSDLKNAQSLKNLEFETVIGSLEPKLVQTMALLAQQENNTEFNKFKSTRFELVEKDANKALLEIMVKDEEPNEEKLTRVGNRWVSEEMASEWDQKMKEINEGINTMENLKPVQKEQVLSIMRMAQAVITELEGANTADELKALANEQMQQFAPILMPLLMGGK